MPVRIQRPLSAGPSDSQTTQTGAANAEQNPFPGAAAGLGQDDLFNEVLVRQAWDGRDFLAVFGLVVLALVLLGLAVYFFTYIAPFLLFILFGAGYLIFRLAQPLSREFEYIATNGSLDVDQITAKTKRRRRLSTERGDLISFGSLRSAAYKEALSRHPKPLDFRSRRARETFYVLARTSGGETLAVLDASEKILSNLRRYQPSKYQAES